MNKHQSNSQSYNKHILSKDYSPILCCSTSIDKSNFYAWYEWWSNEIGKYGEEYQEQFNECMSISFNINQELSQYSLQSELSIDKDYFLMSREQRDELANINDDEDRSYRKREFFVEWANERDAKNLLIRESNIDNKKYREILIDKASKYKDNMMNLISNIMSTMDRNTQDLVKSFRRPFNEGERELLQLENITIESGSRSSQPKYTYQNALKSGNWFHLFEAAKSVTVTRLGDGLDDLTIRERQISERNKLDSLKWSSGKWTNFRRLWKNQLDICESVGCNLLDQDKMIALMSSLNSEVFASILHDYKSSIRRSSLPQTYYELTMFIENEYAIICASNTGLELVRKIESKKKDESIFHTKEDNKSNNKSKNSNKCLICDSRDHNSEKCDYRNNKFTVEQNKWYYNTKIKSDGKSNHKSETNNSKSDSDNESNVEESQEADSDTEDVKEDTKAKWNPSKGTIVTPPNKTKVNNNKKKDEKVNLLVNGGFDPEEVCFKIVEEKTVDIQMNSHFIDLILDTGSEANILNSKYKDTLKNIKKDKMNLKGIDGSKLSSESGSTVFGKTRLLELPNDKCVISYSNVSDDYQMITLDPNTILLKEWSNKTVTGLKFLFKKNKKLYGDRLFHCIVKKDNFKNLTADTNKIYNKVSVNNKILSDAKDLVSMKSKDEGVPTGLIKKKEMSYLEALTCRGVSENTVEQELVKVLHF
jgi:hypothetical protein